MEEKKSKVGLVAAIVGIAVAVAAAVGVTGGIIFAKMFASPEKQLAKGFTNMAVEMKAYTMHLLDDIDFKALAEAKKKQPVHYNVDLSFTLPTVAEGIGNVSAEVDSVIDVKNKQGKVDIKAGAYGIDVEVGSLIADKNTVYLTSDQFLQGDAYSVDLENIGRDFNNSVWARYADVTIPEDASFTLFEEGKYDKAAAHNEELANIFKKCSTEMASAVKYDKITEKKEFITAEGLVNYGGVQVTVGKDGYNTAMENLKNDILASSFYAEYLEQQFYGENYADALGQSREKIDEAVSMLFTSLKAEGDIVLNFYMDRKGRIRSIATPENIPVSITGSDINAISISVDFTGSERALDSVEGGICYYTEADGQVREMGISRTANVTEDFYNEDFTLRIGNNIDESIVFSYVNNWTYEDKSYDITVMLDYDEGALRLSAKGGYEGIEKGKGYTLRLDNATINIDGQDELIVSGTVSEETVENSKIEVPQNATDVLKMSEMDIMSAVMKASAAFEKFQ